eukprot:Skav210339  [mRNA]  locus=scaffold4443:113803:120076:- [translate_table: standard]
MTLLPPLLLLKAGRHQFGLTDAVQWRADAMMMAAASVDLATSVVDPAAAIRSPSLASQGLAVIAGGSPGIQKQRVSHQFLRGSIGGLPAMANKVPPLSSERFPKGSLHDEASSPKLTEQMTPRALFEMVKDDQKWAVLLDDPSGAFGKGDTNCVVCAKSDREGFFETLPQAQHLKQSRCTMALVGMCRCACLETPDVIPEVISPERKLGDTVEVWSSSSQSWERGKIVAFRVNDYVEVQYSHSDQPQVCVQSHQLREPDNSEPRRCYD